MTPARHVLTTKQKLQILLRYSRCPECKAKFGRLEDIEWDHIGQLAITEDNSLENFRPLHAVGCHARKTAKDAGARAKVKRLSKEQEDFRRRVLERPAGQKREPTGKIKSRGFAKAKRGFAGRPIIQNARKAR